MSPATGVVGLGPMGLAIALRLRDAGFPVVATSRSETTRHRAHAAGK
jgi:3-hydroxyisobutyrate dehydrogenase-like beta-hydroxyacid dehydrogenase